MRYGTINAWAEYFDKKEGNNITYSAISRRLKLAEKIGLNGRDKLNRILKNCFYSESDVFEVCADYLEDLLIEDENGLIEKGEAIYGTIAALSKLLNVSKSAIIVRIKKYKISCIKGLRMGGQIGYYYPETKVRQICKDLLEDLPQVDETGFLIENGIKYGTTPVWAEALNVTPATITKRIKIAGLKSIKGKDIRGKIWDFYSEADIRTACADLLQDFPQADESGFFVIDGTKYGTITTWSGILIIKTGTVANRLKNADAKSIKGKSKAGNICNFYSEADVRFACFEYLQEYPHADESGFFEKDRMKYGSIKSWSKSLSVTIPTVAKRLKNADAKSIKGKNKVGQILDFYSESDVHSTCSELLQDIPQADESGFFVIDGIKYGTANAWSKILEISQGVIVKRLKKANLKSIKGKSITGIHDFYSEADVRSNCEELFLDLPHTDGNEFIEKDNIKYGTISNWSKILKISESVIANKLKEADIKSIKGRSKTGVRDFYSEADVRFACTDYLQEMPQADKTGFFSKDGIKYGTVVSWSRDLSFSSLAIAKRIKNADAKSIKGKDKNGHICEFYSEPDVRSACVDFLQDMPQADEAGFFIKGNIKYGSINAWSRILPISIPTIINRLKKADIKSIKGKDNVGHILDFYSEADVRTACADILQDLPQADENGFFTEAGIRYGSIRALADLLKVSKITLSKRIKKLHIQKIKGRNKKGQNCNFYPENAVREIQINSFKKTRESIEDSFFIKNGIRYGTCKSWSKYFKGVEGFKVSKETIYNRLKKAEIVGITAQGEIMHIQQNAFYSESDIRLVCADFLQNLPLLNNSGFFEKDGIKYGAVSYWKKIFGKKGMKIQQRLLKANCSYLKGKCKGGRILCCYSESDVRTVCTDLFQELPQADKNNFIKIEGVRYATCRTWSYTLPISRQTIVRNINKAGTKSIKGRDNGGRVFDFYSENDVMSACAEALKYRPQADESGFIEIDGTKYGTIKVWANELCISQPTIITRLENSKKQSIKARDINKIVREFYSEDDIRSACSDLLQELPRTDKNGFIKIDGIRFATANKWAHTFNLEKSSVYRTISKSNYKGINGKDKKGHICTFYSETDILSACADILAKRNAA